MLAHRPALRAGLAEAPRVERLLADVRSVRLRIHRLPTGMRRETVEVLAAMRVLGLVHRLGGRPAPGDQVVGEDDAVARIVGRIAENPYAEGVTVDEPDVRDLVREHLTGVAPWPLHALVD